MFPSRANEASGQQQQQQLPIVGFVAGAHYGGQYASLYGSTAQNSGLQALATSAIGAGSSVLEGSSGNALTMQGSLKYTPGGYTAARFTDSVAFSHQHQPSIYERLDSAAALRQQLLQTHSLQSAFVDRSSRQADYLATRSAIIPHAGQGILPYGGRIDDDLHTLSMISGRHHAPSILGAASRREAEDLVYAHNTVNSGYRVSLPPGRDYVLVDSLLGNSMESAYPGGILAHAGYSRLDDRKDDLVYAREIERIEEDRRRERLRERDREVERDRQHRREREIRRGRTPTLISRDRDRSASATRSRSLRRESLRRRSPAKEKRREYVCKVYSSNLVDTVRDYISMDKRYSRLFVSSECSKVIVNWSKENLNIPFNTPIRFEYDFVQEETPSEHELAYTKTLFKGNAKLESGTTRWNAKMLLMSGLSPNAWEELSSDRKYEDRIPHICNMLRFALLKDGDSLLAIGGSWDTADGDDPVANKSTLIQTVSRYAKELTWLDLKNCRNWNPFLEIHYDRVGKDGLFSHKEITVLYIPDLSDCLPSIDAWRDQWLAHKNAVAERERLHSLKREKSRKKKEVSKDKESKTKTDLKNVDKREKDGENIVIEKKEKDMTITEKNGGKKVIRKVIKKKVVVAKNAPKQIDTDTEVITEDAESSGILLPANTNTKKKAIKKSQVVKTAKKENEVKEPECSDDKTKNVDVVAKTASKKKIIKKVTKKKVAAKDATINDKMLKGNEAGSNTDEVKSEKNKAFQQDVGGSTGIGNKSEKIQVEEEKETKVKGGCDKIEKLKSGKQKEDKDVKTETMGKEVKDKRKVYKPPKYPGLILQTKGDKNSNLRSLSLSLDSLLDYTDKDTEESTFEVSLFAETFYEMLQYQMGSRILTFLQKLRIKFVAKRNQKKRQREEASERKGKDRTNKSSSKRHKPDDATVKSKSAKAETLQEDEKDMVIDNVENMKTEDKSEEDDPEEELENDNSEEEAEDDLEELEEEQEDLEELEALEEDENMTEASPKYGENEEKAEVDRVDMDVKSKKKDEKVNMIMEKKDNSKAGAKKKKETPVTIDKELLQAFRFFDRNRVGYIRVEDLRLILHSLGKSMSHRNVKELVQSALLESNTGRDDRILYKKLVKMTDI